MAKYLAPDGYTLDPNSGLYYKQNIETDAAGNRIQNVMWFNADTGEYRNVHYELPPEPVKVNDKADNQVQSNNPAQSKNPVKKPEKKKSKAWIGIISAVAGVAVLGGVAIFILNKFELVPSWNIPFLSGIFGEKNGTAMGRVEGEEDDDRNDENGASSESSVADTSESEGAEQDESKPQSVSDWRDYVIDDSELKVAIVSSDLEKLDSITLIGTGNLDRSFPLITGTESDVEGFAYYKWSVGFGDYEVALFKKFDGSSGDIMPKDMEAGVLNYSGEVISQISFEIKDGSITFLNIPFPDDMDAMTGYENVTAHVRVVDKYYDGQIVPLSINGKLCENFTPAYDSFESIEKVSETYGSYYVYLYADELPEMKSDYDSSLMDMTVEDAISELIDNPEYSGYDDIESGGFMKDSFIATSEYSPDGVYIGTIFGEYTLIPQSDEDEKFFESDGFPTIFIGMDGYYEMFFHIGGDSWIINGLFSVKNLSNEDDDIHLYLYDATTSAGDKVTAEFVFSDSRDYPILMTDGFGYMGMDGAPYTFVRSEMMGDYATEYETMIMDEAAGR